MTAVQVTNISVLNNPCNFLEPFRFEITFEASQQLEEDLEWRLTYVGSADSEQHDQILDSVLVGPVPIGVNRFVFEAPHPDPSKIPAQDLIGVTVVLLECLYKDRTFVRVGYYVSNENPDEPSTFNLAEMKDGNSRATLDDNDGMMDVEDLKSESEEEENDVDEDVPMATDNAKENIVQPMDAPQEQKKPVVIIPPSKIKRYILEDKPRVTRFPIEWDTVAVPLSGSGEQQLQMQQI